jgi:hypothetical protein
MSWFAGGAGMFAAGRVRRIVLRVLGVVLLGLFVYFAISAVQVLAASKASQQPAEVAKTTYIVVVGEHESTEALSKDMKARLDQALSLYQSGRGKKIIIAVTNCASCGTGADAVVPGPPHGKAATFLEMQSLPAKRLVEVRAGDDDALLASVAALIPRRGSHAVIIVSDPLDDLRLRGTAASHGLAPEMSPATPPSSGVLSDAGAIGQQAFAVAIGRVFGFSLTGWASN